MVQYEDEKKVKLNVVKETKKQISRINPNMLFVNLDKQNPKQNETKPKFKTKKKNK